MSKVDLIATKAMRYGGRALIAGDPFQASRRDARTLTAIRKAEAAPDDAAADLPPGGGTPDPIEALRAAYRTASGAEPDMRWGTSRLEKEIATAGGSGSQGYQRRDMRAQD